MPAREPQPLGLHAQRQLRLPFPLEDDRLPKRAGAGGGQCDVVATAEPVRRPPKDVLPKFELWLKQQRQPYVAVDEAKRALFAEVTTRTLDFILYDEQLNLLVTVRPYLRANERNDMRRWQEVFGPDFQAVRIWPVETPGGWTWIHHAIEPCSVSP